MILPIARYQWTHLRIQDFKSVAEYNSAMFRISSQMKLCGETITEEDMLEKTFSTFHASNVLMQQQYRERGFTEYNQLIYVFLVTEQSNGLMLKNHQSQPPGSAPFPEVNVVSLKVNATASGGNNHKRGCSHRCGDNGHWARTCRTPKHLVDLYQTSIKDKGVKTNFLDQAKPMDIFNPICDLSGQLNTTHLDVSDFIVERGNEVYRSD
ncbi:uncharacterized protein LOC126611850 [Malus sylvestris]|uniref:uncharacterized protein LOC126611850 n=1 Tax=Malus sylvestris TaxID=3752 RepID=UPI0021AC1B4E|nr:uncharacterized protein LOC126611850 [Malus sylvestris]